MWDDAERTRWERHLRTMVASAGANDPEAFAELVALADWLGREGLPAAAEGLTAQGYSWADIARPLGRDKSSAFRRFRKSSIGT